MDRLARFGRPKHMKASQLSVTERGVNNPKCNPWTWCWLLSYFQSKPRNDPEKGIKRRLLEKDSDFLDNRVMDETSMSHSIPISIGEICRRGCFDLHFRGIILFTVAILGLLRMEGYTRKHT